MNSKCTDSDWESAISYPRNGVLRSIWWWRALPCIDSFGHPHFGKQEKKGEKIKR